MELPFTLVTRRRALLSPRDPEESPRQSAHGVGASGVVDFYRLQACAARAAAVSLRGVPARLEIAPLAPAAPAAGGRL